MYAKIFILHMHILIFKKFEEHGIIELFIDFTTYIRGELRESIAIDRLQINLHGMSK